MKQYLSEEPKYCCLINISHQPRYVLTNKIVDKYLITGQSSCREKRRRQNNYLQYQSERCQDQTNRDNC